MFWNNDAYTLEFSCASYEFACTSGDQCVSSSYQCDGVFDCRDHSDEQDCRKLTFDINQSNITAYNITPLSLCLC